MAASDHRSNTHKDRMADDLAFLPLQQRFSEIVHRFEQFRLQQREAERQAEHLFQTLLHRAFNGEV